MNLTEQLLACVETFCDAKGIAEATLSTRLFNDGSTLARIRSGGSLTVRSYEKAMAHFAENWPADRPWPVGRWRQSAEAA